MASKPTTPMAKPSHLRRFALKFAELAEVNLKVPEPVDEPVESVEGPKTFKRDAPNGAPLFCFILYIA